MNNKLNLQQNIISRTPLEKKIYDAAFEGAFNAVDNIKKLRLSSSSKSRGQVLGRLRNGARKNTLNYKQHRKIRSKIIEDAIIDVFKDRKLKIRLTFGGKKKKKSRKRNSKKRNKKTRKRNRTRRRINVFKYYNLYSKIKIPKKSLHKSIAGSLKGIIVVAPPGSGKSYWLSNNKGNKWEEADDLYVGDTRNLNMESIKEFDKQNIQFKSQGKHILTSIWYEPDIIDYVIEIPLETLKKNLQNEERIGNNPEEAMNILRKFVDKRKIIKAKTFSDAMKIINEKVKEKSKK